MKTLILFCWAFFFPLCWAQCTLELPEPVLFDALNKAGLVEYDPLWFTLLDLTYLCYARSPVDKARFDQVRVSVQYTYVTMVPRSAQATFVCVDFEWTLAPYSSSVTHHKHFTKDMTREGCQDCLDHSMFAQPTFCRLDDPCVVAPCANGGSCSRTGLTDFSCACERNWNGALCKTCPLTCQNGGTLSARTCTCKCMAGYSGANCESNKTASCSRVCLNGGILDTGTCTCVCADGYSGANCEVTKVKVHCNTTCQNGGTLDAETCVCNCTGDFSGPHCEACSMTCQNGGTLNTETCTCKCMAGYSGANCESNKTASCSRMCLNGGILDTGTCTCVCADGYSGANCEVAKVRVHCNKTCQNGGTLNAETCACNCTGDFSGSHCEGMQGVKGGGGIHSSKHTAGRGGKEGGGGGLGAGAIVGIVVGCAAVLTVLPTVIILINAIIVG